MGNSDRSRIIVCRDAAHGGIFVARCRMMSRGRFSLETGTLKALSRRYGRKLIQVAYISCTCRNCRRLGLWKDHPCQCYSRSVGQKICGIDSLRCILSRPKPYLPGQTRTNQLRPSDLHPIRPSNRAYKKAAGRTIHRETGVRFRAPYSCFTWCPGRSAQGSSHRRKPNFSRKSIAKAL